MELATALIWTLRILLPIILFFIYFKLQSPKEEQQPAGPTGQNYSRGQLLAYRKVVLATSPVPQELADIKLKTQSEAPNLFVGGAPGRGPRSAPSRREPERSGGGGSGAEKQSGGPSPPRERREKRGEGKKPESKPRRPEGEEPESPTAAEAVPADSPEAKMHLESLLNYVAFNRNHQQRVFLPDEAVGPPPPPPKPKAKAGGRGISGPTAEKANAEAQMVLRGAIRFKRCDVARDIYAQLCDSEVEISERTFALMIEACVATVDLKSASDFLMKMETSGYNPDSDLLDKVMDLYSAQKSLKEQEKQRVTAEQMVPPHRGFHGFALAAPPADAHDCFAQAVAEAASGIEVALLAPTLPASAEDPAPSGTRTKLSTSAPAFVPSFGVPVAPPADAPGQDAVEGGRTKLSTAAPAFVPSFTSPMPPPQPRPADMPGHPRYRGGRH